MKVYLTVR